MIVSAGGAASATLLGIYSKAGSAAERSTNPGSNAPAEKTPQDALQPPQPKNGQEIKAKASGAGNKEQLSEDEKKAVEQLKKIDREVRAHEAAHLAAASGIASSGANFSYQRGPDGQLYAVGGEVNIDASPVPGDPEATIRKAEQIRRAALAPANPSGQDQSVAASAIQMAAQAQAELASQKLNGKTDAYTATANDGGNPTGTLVDITA